MRTTLVDALLGSLLVPSQHSTISRCAFDGFAGALLAMPPRRLGDPAIGQRYRDEL